MKQPQVEIQPFTLQQDWQPIAAEHQGRSIHPSIRPLIQPLFQPAYQPVCQPEQTSAQERLELLLRQFYDQMQSLNQLAAEQEAAMQQFLALVQQIEAARTQPQDRRPDFLSRLQAQEQTARLIAAKLGSIVLLVLETIAALLVRAGEIFRRQMQLTRSLQRSGRAKHLRRSILRQPCTFRSEALQPAATEQTSCQTETAVFPATQEALKLTLGAALLRIGLDWLVQLYPGLWWITILLMVLPAAAAVYRSTRSPRSGFLWGVRLTLILIGLLLGGRV